MALRPSICLSTVVRLLFMATCLFLVVDERHFLANAFGCSDIANMGSNATVDLEVAGTAILLQFCTLADADIIFIARGGAFNITIEDSQFSNTTLLVVAVRPGYSMADAATIFGATGNVTDGSIVIRRSGILADRALNVTYNATKALTNTVFLGQVFAQHVFGNLTFSVEESNLTIGSRRSTGAILGRSLSVSAISIGGFSAVIRHGTTISPPVTRDMASMSSVLLLDDVKRITAASLQIMNRSQLYDLSSVISFKGPITIGTMVVVMSARCDINASTIVLLASATILGNISWLAADECNLTGANVLLVAGSFFATPGSTSSMSVVHSKVKIQGSNTFFLSFTGSGDIQNATASFLITDRSIVSAQATSLRLFETQLTACNDVFIDISDWSEINVTVFSMMQTNKAVSNVRLSIVNGSNFIILDTGVDFVFSYSHPSLKSSVLIVDGNSTLTVATTGQLTFFDAAYGATSLLIDRGSQLSISAPITSSDR